MCPGNACETRLVDCKPVSTLLEAGRKFQKLSEEETHVEVKKYQQMIGSLTYVTTATRPDLTAAANTLSKFMAKPGKEHMEEIKRILRFIKETVNYGLCYNATVVFWLDILMPIGQGILIPGILLLAKYFRYTITQLAGAARS